MEDAEGGGDFALERIVSMRGRWRDHLMTGLYSGCSIWHSDTYDYWLNVPSLRKTFLGRKIVRYFRSLLWKWDRLVSGMEHTHSANREWTAPLGGLFDSSTGCAHHSQLCARFVLLICCVADGYRSRVDMWQHFMIPASRLGG
jgi:hypothetical protein